MKSKYLLIKLFGVVFILLIVASFFLFYFFPSLQTIHRKKRELKDMNHKITNYMQVEKDFDFTNDAEKAFFKAADDSLLKRIPTIQNREDFIMLFTRIFDQVKQLARRDGISNMMLTSASKELEVNAATLSRDKVSFRKLVTFVTSRMNELERDRTGKAGPGRDVGMNTAARRAPPPLLPNMKHHTVFLSFSGDLRHAMNFINHIPWGSYYLKPGKIVVASGDIAPYIMVDLRVYYIDQRPKEKKSNRNVQ